MGTGEPLTLICRSEIDAVTTTASGEEQFMNIKALNEWDFKGGARFAFCISSAWNYYIISIELHNKLLS